MRQKSALIVAAVAVSAGGNFSFGIDRTWINTTSGYFDVASNWSPAGSTSSTDNMVVNQPGVFGNSILFDAITGSQTVNSVNLIAGSPRIVAIGGVRRLTSMNTSTFSGSGALSFESNNGLMEFESPTVIVNSGRFLFFNSSTLSSQTGWNSAASAAASCN